MPWLGLHSQHVSLAPALRNQASKSFITNAPPGAGTPSKAFAECGGCQAGDEVEVVFCYPPGTPLSAGAVTRGSIEFLSSSQEAASEPAPSYASLAAMRGAWTAGTRYYYSSASGLLFVRVRQAAGWGGAAPTGYCPPGGCSWVVVGVTPSAAGPSASTCEARLVAVAGAVQTDATTDPFLSAKLPPALFSLASTCPSLSPLPMCDCFGYIGCASRYCTTPERQTCDAR